MQQVMPAKFLKLRLIAEVPRSEYISNKTPKHLQDKEKRSSFIKKLRLVAGKKPEKTTDFTVHSYKFNVAAWLKTNKAQAQPISLMLRFEDSKGAFVVMIEETLIETHLPIMFSGLASFKTRGELKSLQVCAAGISPDETIIVDELFVQRSTDEEIAIGTHEKSA